MIPTTILKFLGIPGIPGIPMESLESFVIGTCSEVAQPQRNMSFVVPPTLREFRDAMAALPYGCTRVRHTKINDTKSEIRYTTPDGFATLPALIGSCVAPRPPLEWSNIVVVPGLPDRPITFCEWMNSVWDARATPTLLPSTFVPTPLLPLSDNSKTRTTDAIAALTPIVGHPDDLKDFLEDRDPLDSVLSFYTEKNKLKERVQLVAGKNAIKDIIDKFDMRRNEDLERTKEDARLGIVNERIRAKNERAKALCDKQRAHYFELRRVIIDFYYQNQRTRGVRAGDSALFFVK